jgi:tryptophan synthase alpha chain
MSRLAGVFARAREENRAALIIYVCAGDPDIDTTVRLVQAAAEAGADAIELGMPFSDQTADGPVIQRASERALAKGTRMHDVLGAARRIREASDIGLVLFGYYNPILAYGEAELAAAAKQAGVDALLVVDLPPEEASPLLSQLKAQQLEFIPFVAPTTSPARIKNIVQSASSFLYYVSITGVTGAEANLDVAARRAAEVRSQTGLPVAVGFGVKTPDHARAVAMHADGVIVGAAVCSAIEAGKTPDDAVKNVRELVRSLRAACAR